MTENDYNARFLAIAADRIDIGDVLVEFRDGDIPCRVRHDGSAWIVEENEPDFDGWGCGYHPCDYMIACIIQRQLRKWLGRRGITVMQCSDGTFLIDKWAMAFWDGDGWGLRTDIESSTLCFPDYESAQLAGFEVALKEE